MKNALLLALMLVVVSCAGTQQLGPRYEPPPEVEVVAFQAVPLDVGRWLPADTTTGYVDSFTINCTSAAAVLIAPPSGGYTMRSYSCQNDSTTKVHVGDSTISDPGTTRDAPIYCATNCPSQEWGASAFAEYCRGDSNTTIYCRALVRTGSAP